MSKSNILLCESLGYRESTGYCTFSGEIVTSNTNLLYAFCQDRRRYSMKLPITLYLGLIKNDACISKLTLLVKIKFQDKSWRSLNKRWYWIGGRACHRKKVRLPYHILVIKKSFLKVFENPGLNNMFQLCLNSIENAIERRNTFLHLLVWEILRTKRIFFYNQPD